MNLTAAIRSMTSLPAEKFHMKGRGRIEKGNYANNAVINISTLTARSTYRQPALSPVGLEYLLVNGEVSIEHGNATGKNQRHGVTMDMKK